MKYNITIKQKIGDSDFIIIPNGDRRYTIIEENKYNITKNDKVIHKNMIYSLAMYWLEDYKREAMQSGQAVSFISINNSIQLNAGDDVYKVEGV